MDVAFSSVQQHPDMVLLLVSVARLLALPEKLNVSADRQQVTTQRKVKRRWEENL
ncbi:hypothetical protein JRQ81_019522 [Phrynocephalus forsythii]|uniref:Uncharacterized protein n=1 Tax=Phrynocephalus forsythii TaxID=171643 RepID=A0A9Q0XM89_9SAUR|nr:hypothetical protein JRQ81_019522 [Phrynocephalus forsythii]